jgi:hypothetical protein
LGVNCSTLSLFFQPFIPLPMQGWTLQLIFLYVIRHPMHKGRILFYILAAFYHQ